MIRKMRLFFFVLPIVFLCEISFLPVVCSRSLSEDEQMIQVGIGAFQDGLYDIAERQFTLFLSDFPSHAKASDVAYLLGKTFVLRGKWNEARSAFSRIIQENRHFDSMDYVLFWMAQAEARLGNSEMSRKWLLSLIQNHPKFEWMDYAYYLLGCLEAEANRFNSAESSLKKVSLYKREELLRPASFWLGMVALKQNAFERAILYLKPLWEDAKSLPPSFRGETLFWLSEAQLRSGQLQEALRNYQTYYNQFKSDPLTAQACWRIGYCEYLLGNLKDSVDHFKNFQGLFREGPLHVYTHYILGEIYLFLGDHATSVKEFNQVLQAPSSHPLWGASLFLVYWNDLQSDEREEANRIAQRILKLHTMEDEKGLIQWLTAQSLLSEGKALDALPYYFSLLNSRFRERSLLQIGKGYFLENQFREALTNTDILLLEFPTFKSRDEALFMKGECLFRLGDTSRAFEAYNRVVAQPGRNPWNLMALTQIGLCDLMLHEGGRAEVAFKKILEDFPDHPLFYHAAFQIGILHEEKQDLQGASHFYGLVLKGKLPELLAATYFRIGEILIDQGKEEKALASFQAALPHLSDRSPWFGITQLEIGNLRRRRGEIGEAKKSYRIVQTQSPDEEIKKSARQLLDQLETR